MKSPSRSKSPFRVSRSCGIQAEREILLSVSDAEFNTRWVRVSPESTENQGAASAEPPPDDRGGNAKITLHTPPRKVTDEPIAECPWHWYR
jgi:hypothetical protein